MKMADNISVGIVIANEIIREGMCHILADREISVAFSASSMSEIDVSSAPDALVVVMGLGATDNILEACDQLATMFPRAKHVLTASDFRLEDMILAFEKGVHGLILGGASCDQFAGAIRLVALGERVLPGKVADYLVGRRPSEIVDTPAQSQAVSGLSHREIDILNHLVDGDANKVIARRLNIAEATVKVHVKTILRKLQLANRTQAAIWATKHQLHGSTRQVERRIGGSHALRVAH
jgi:two-component system, NarL family, nitrate/nitrite response regulator NarL